MIPASIPSPPLDWAILLQFGGLTVRTYAIMILIGIVFAVWMTRRRWVARGGDVAAIEEIAVWAIPAGIIGGRIYHVISTPGPYFGANGHWVDAFKIWNGGLGIWGAVAIGSLGAYFGCRRVGVSFSTFMDAAAPGILGAQAIGRLGNYFNQELFGGPTNLPWGLEIDPASPSFPRDMPLDTLFHPTFLYELLWNVAGVILILALDRRFQLRWGRVFWLYVIVYTSGRLWIEMVRIDEAVHIGGLRINVWVSMGVLLMGIIAFLVIGRRHRGEPVPVAPAATVDSSKATAKSPASKAKATTTAKKAPANSAAPAKKAPAKASAPAKKATATKSAAASAAKAPAKKPAAKRTASPKKG